MEIVITISQMPLAFPKEHPTREQLVELLTQVKSKLRAHPENYDQSSYCGTRCCIGGWMYRIVTGQTLDENFSNSDAITMFLEWCFGGGELPWLVGLTHPCWPRDLAVEFHHASRANSMSGMAEVGCKAIDRWIGLGDKAVEGQRGY